MDSLINFSLFSDQDFFMNKLQTIPNIDNLINEYFDQVMQGALIFREGIKYYLRGDHDLFRDHLNRLDRAEGAGDSFRRMIETMIYNTKLIPEDRGDVLGLIENSDKILNKLSLTLIEIDIQTPEFPGVVKPLIQRQGDMVSQSVEGMVLGIRAFFARGLQCQECIQTVMRCEKETDNIGNEIRSVIFKSSMDLALKNHIRYFVSEFENIADQAEDVCDRLSIALIKRKD